MKAGLNYKFPGAAFYRHGSGDGADRGSVVPRLISISLLFLGLPAAGDHR
jgi:hypothetical protein